MATKTSETMSSAAATLSGAVSGALSGGLNVGVKTKESSSVTRTGGGGKDREADKLYEERMEEEYAKREGGA
jgi:hypothetical protein